MQIRQHRELRAPKRHGNDRALHARRTLDARRRYDVANAVVVPAVAYRNPEALTTLGSPWLFAMAAAGACSAGAILLIRESPKFANGVPPMIAVGGYLLLGGIVVLGIAVLSGATVTWPGPVGMLGIALIGILLAALEVLFVLAARWNMRLPDGLIVYNVVSLALVAIVTAFLYRDHLTGGRIVGLLLGIVSMFLLLQKGL
jgi:hypothetical protein